jgi:transcriptional regulator GlxA family with amidase domain
MTDRLYVLIAALALCGTLASAGHSRRPAPQSLPSPTKIGALKPPTLGNGVINVAFIISEGTTVIDLAGPWEVFQDAMLSTKGQVWQGNEDDMIMPFNVYTVSDSKTPVSANGLILTANYTFEDAPKPQVIVIPAQGGRTEAQKQWLLASAKTADVTMSVCTGASMLAAYGLLDHKQATTHHSYIQQMQKKYPAVEFVSGTRFVENQRVSTAGGLSSGIDLALHVVERYYGREIAQSTADFMEYKGQLWKNPQYADIKQVSAAR